LVDYQLTRNQLASYQDDNITLATDMLNNGRNNNSCTLDEVNGIALIKQLRTMSHYALPAILITATTDENLMMLAK
jgi:hypothetical protein